MTAGQQHSNDTATELETEFHRIRKAFEVVPTFEQFEELEALAARLEVIVKPATRGAACIDMVTGSPVDAGLARELLEVAEPRRWQLDAAQAHQAEIVATIGDNANWRQLDAMQRRALSAWHLQYPSLTYGTITTIGPQMARRRLSLHRCILGRSKPGLTLQVGSRHIDVGNVEPEPVAVPASAPAPTAAARGVALTDYIVVDRLTDIDLDRLRADGLIPPADARGYIAIDPYGLTNNLHEVVINYLDKLEVATSSEGVHNLLAAVAGYNDMDKDAELREGQIVWFPGKQVLQEWLQPGRSPR